MAAGSEIVENYYQLLGLEKFETDKELIKSQYESLISHYSEADRKVNVHAQKIKKAYQVLMDDVKRVGYNLRLEPEKLDFSFFDIRTASFVRSEPPDWYKKAGGNKVEFYRNITIENYFGIEKGEIQSKHLIEFKKFIEMLKEIFPAARIMHDDKIVNMSPDVLTYLESLNYKNLSFLELKRKLEKTILLVEKISEFRAGLKSRYFNPKQFLQEMKILIQEGADLTVTGAGEWNVLHCAAYVNSESLVFFIKDRGTEEEKQQLLAAKTSSTGTTPINMAESRFVENPKYSAMVQLLRSMHNPDAPQNSSQALSKVMSLQGFHKESQKKVWNTLRDHLNSIPGAKFEFVKTSRGVVKPHLRMTYSQHTEKSQAESLIAVLKSCYVTVELGSKGSQLLVMVTGVEDSKKFQENIKTLQAIVSPPISGITPGCTQS